ncbi:MAG: hypothetical protein WC696_03565 [Candidatus Methylopumilus sp.]|jgi:hypothetical protein
MGRMEEISQLVQESINVDVPAMLFDIQQRYRTGITALELYEATRGAWHVGSRRENARYAFAVSEGVVREVYEIHSWHRAGTTPYRIKPFANFPVDGRWEFIGKPAAEVLRTKYKGSSVVKYFNKSQQNHVAYANC